VHRERGFEGKKSVPTKGTVDDIRMLSAMLHYCDAIYVDRQMHSILTDGRAG
jgi:hypothetical protein